MRGGSTLISLHLRHMNCQRTFRNIALVGFMGSGKSTVGRLIAQQLRFEFVDTDALIEARAGSSIAEIFEKSGETTFRSLEKQIVAELSGFDSTVISTGGGLPANAENFASIKQHSLVVCLWASAEVIWERVKHQTHRPLLRRPDPLGTIRQLLIDREPFYKQADVLVHTEMRPAKEVAQHVLHQYYAVRADGAAHDGSKQ
jgi:shikimate kinase